MKVARTSVAAVIAFFVFAIGAVAFRYVINALGSLMLFGFANTERAFYNLDSAANILGLIGAVYVAFRVFDWIRGKNGKVSDQPATE